MDELIFDDLERKQIPVSIGGKKYTLWEATGEMVIKYRNETAKYLKIGTEGRATTVEGSANADPYLVSLCLTDEAGGPVSMATIKSWPNKVSQTLYEKAKELSGIDEDEQSLLKQMASIKRKLEVFQERTALKNERLMAMADGSA